jgi:trans-2,3-dihydro-3-hydroxyanthranilate isomerase
MRDYSFRIVNVFAEQRLGGNPLAVVERAEGLDSATMQAIALQFNLSETTFILPSATANARVRIFTPTFEMPFAGHPTLGSAHVVRDLGATGDAVTLEMISGIVPVTAQGDRWTLEAKAPRTRQVGATREDIAAMLRLDARDLGADALRVDTGTEQLVIPLASADAVRRAAPDAALLERHGSVTSDRGVTRAMAYVWAYDASAGPNHVSCRFFFPKHGAVIEDPGTGSACANLGGWLVVTGATLPQTLALSQGEAVGRPCHLGLSVDAQRRIFVSGRVIALGSGTLCLD